MEIFHDGHWGTVCDDSWDIRDAEVVCRQFGYRRAHLAAHTSLFGQGNGHIWVDEVNCIGNETSLDECTHAGWNNHDCSHYEDASVICSNDTAFYFGECCVVTMSLCVNCIVSVPFLPLCSFFTWWGGLSEMSQDWSLSYFINRLRDCTRFKHCLFPNRQKIQIVINHCIPLLIVIIINFI